MRREVAEKIGDAIVFSYDPNLDNSLSSFEDTVDGAMRGNCISITILLGHLSYKSDLFLTLESMLWSEWPDVMVKFAGKWGPR